MSEGGKLDAATKDFIRRLAGLGLTTQEIAHVTGVPSSTFYYRMSRDPTISEAIQQGKAQFKADLLTRAFKRARHGDSDMLKFLLARVCGVNEKQVHEHRFGASVDYSEMTLEQLDDQRKQIEERLNCLNNQTVMALLPAGSTPISESIPASFTATDSEPTTPSSETPNAIPLPKLSTGSY